MTFTPFENQMLREQRRTNELLELLVMAHMPMKMALGVGQDPAEAAATVEKLAHEVRAGQVLTGPASATEVGQLRPAVPEGLTEMMARAAGLTPMRQPGQPETPEQRQERFAARAKEVGLSAEQVEEVSGRVQLNLDALTRCKDCGTTNSVHDGTLHDETDRARATGAAPAKKAPAKKAARPRQ